MESNLPIDLELVALRQLSSKLTSAASMVTWRSFTQRRMARIAGVLRTLARTIIGTNVSSERVAGSWVFTAMTDSGPVTVAEVVTSTPGRTLDDLAAPILVRVRRPDLLDPLGLGRLEARPHLTVARLQEAP